MAGTRRTGRLRALIPLVPAVLLGIASTVLLVLVSVSTPITKSISFLNVPIDVAVQILIISIDVTRTLTFGVFGYCVADLCSNTQLGYDTQFTSTALGALGVAINGKADLASITGISDSLIETLSKVLVIHPIAAGLVGLATILALIALIPKATPTFAAIAAWFAALGMVASLIATVFDLVLWTIARNRINDAATANVAGGVATVNASASYGKAIWLTLASFICALLSFIFIIVAAIISRRARAARRKQRNSGYATMPRTSVDADKATGNWVEGQGEKLREATVPQMSPAPAAQPLPVVESYSVAAPIDTRSATPATSFVPVNEPHHHGVPMMQLSAAYPASATSNYESRDLTPASPISPTSPVSHYEQPLSLAAPLTPSGAALAGYYGTAAHQAHA